MTTSEDNNFIPKNYNELYSHYIEGDGRGNSLCLKIIRQMLPYRTQDEVETLTQEVIIKAMRGRIIEKFDPSKANFGGMIFVTTRSTVVNYLSRKSRNPITGLNGGSLVVIDTEEVCEPGVYSLDRLFPAEKVNTEAACDAKKAVGELLRWADNLLLNATNKRDSSIKDLLFLIMEERNVKECSEELEVTPSTIHNWMVYVKMNASAILS